MLKGCESLRVRRVLSFGEVGCRKHDLAGWGLGHGLRDDLELAAHDAFFSSNLSTNTSN